MKLTEMSAQGIYIHTEMIITHFKGDLTFSLPSYLLKEKKYFIYQKIIFNTFRCLSVRIARNSSARKQYSIAKRFVKLICSNLQFQTYKD